MKYSKKKVLLIQGLLAPYRYPIFEGISKDKSLDFEVWFMGRKTKKSSVKNRIWDEEDLKPFSFKHRFLNGITLNFGIKDNYPIWFNFSIWRLLYSHKPDVVVMMGWDSLTSFIVHLYCIFSKTKFVLYSDSTLEERSWRRSLMKKIVSWHVINSDSLISGGTRNKEYLLSLGANVDKIHVSYNTVDIEKYMKLTTTYKVKYKETKTELGINDKKVIMFYGQFIERKGIDVLVKAFNVLKEKRKDIFLLLIGSGQFKIKIESLISRKKIDDVLLFENPGDTDICKYYAISDLFVLPSKEEVWGLVVNEAMASSLPVVVSSKAGCSEDLIVEGYNGYTFESENVNELVSKIEKCLFEDDSIIMGQNSLDLVKKFNPKLTTQMFIDAINY